MIADSRIHLNALRAQFRASLAVQFQYRTSQVIWLLFFILQPTMYLSIWSAVARSRPVEISADIRRVTWRRTSWSACGLST